VHEHEAFDRRDLVHARKKLGIRDMGIGRLGEWHEGLEPHCALTPLLSDLREGRRCERAPEAEVDDDLLLRHLALLAIERGGRYRWIGERMFDHRRDAPCRRRHRAGREVLSLGVAWVLEVSVGVDRTGHDDQAGCIDDLVGAVRAPGVSDRSDELALDQQIGRKDPVVRGHGASRHERALAAHAPTPEGTAFP
jgi:hypothetical protein